MNEDDKQRKIWGKEQKEQKEKDRKERKRTFYQLILDDSPSFS